MNIKATYYNLFNHALKDYENGSLLPELLPKRPKKKKDLISETLVFTGRGSKIQTFHPLLYKQEQK